MGLLSLRASRLPSGVYQTSPRRTCPSLAEVLEAVRGWTPDRRGDWEERAAIRELDGGLSTHEAEVLAFLDLQGGDTPQGGLAWTP